MKKRLAILLFSGFIASVGTASAQVPGKFWSPAESKHALEITTGYPTMHYMDMIIHILSMQPIVETVQGVERDRWFTGCVNLSYVYSHKKHWEFSPMVHIYTIGWRAKQYPEITGTDGNQEYDYNADPVSMVRQHKVGAAVNFAARYKWLVRENWCMYSAFGLGVSTTVWYPLPYLAPLGIKFGGKRVYGLVELGISQATTGTVGLGIRL